MTQEPLFLLLYVELHPLRVCLFLLLERPQFSSFCEISLGSVLALLLIEMFGLLIGVLLTSFFPILGLVKFLRGVKIDGILGLFGKDGVLLKALVLDQ